MGRLLIGTSAWSDLGPFYPAGLKPVDQLRFYASVFPIVEVNTTYYRVPSASMVHGWLERTPPEFIFDVKPPRELTATPVEPGAKAPEPDVRMAETFGRAIRPLAEAGRLGAVTFQFPPSWRNTDEHHDYLRLLPELFPDYPVSVEFRRRDWLDPEHADATLELLTASGLSYTMVDEPQAGSGTVPPVYGVTNPALAIVRFHGRNAATWYHSGETSHGRFDWDYSAAELQEWIPSIRRAQSAAAEVHIFFNTNNGDQGTRNAFLLMEQLGVTPPPVPTVPQDPAAPVQLRLV